MKDEFAKTVETAKQDKDALTAEIAQLRDEIRRREALENQLNNEIADLKRQGELDR